MYQRKLLSSVSLSLWLDLVWVCFHDKNDFDVLLILQGPMIFAPLSEVLGRRIVYATTLLVAVIFIIPCARAPNIQTLLVCRAIDGIAFSAPMTLVGGIYNYLLPKKNRSL